MCAATFLQNLASLTARPLLTAARNTTLSTDRPAERLRRTARVAAARRVRPVGQTLVAHLDRRIHPSRPLAGPVFDPAARRRSHWASSALSSAGGSDLRSSRPRRPGRR